MCDAALPLGLLLTKKINLAQCFHSVAIILKGVVFRSSPLWQNFGDGAKNLMVLKELFHNKICFFIPMQTACEVTIHSSCVFLAWRFAGLPGASGPEPWDLDFGPC